MSAPTAESISRDSTLWLAEKIGYLLIPGAPLYQGASYLLVALRPRPTRAHFDPELVKYWSISGDCAEPLELEWPTIAPSAPYAWGEIRIVDRIGATNRFVSFGGLLTVARETTVDTALFGSDAPILGLGGHSDPADPLAASVDGFFAVLRAAAGNDPDIARLSTSLSPNALYAAFLWRALRNYQSATASDCVAPQLISLLRSERRRIEVEFNPDELAGRDLAQRLNRKR